MSNLQDNFRQSNIYIIGVPERRLQKKLAAKYAAKVVLRGKFVILVIEKKKYLKTMI